MMKNQLIRIVLAVVAVGALIGTAAIVSADASDTTVADSDTGMMSQMTDHMSDHTPGDHHDGEHAEHHADHADQHTEHHQNGGHC